MTITELGFADDLGHFIDAKLYQMRTKLAVYQAAVLSALLYGAETWTTTMNVSIWTQSVRSWGFLNRLTSQTSLFMPKQKYHVLLPLSNYADYDGLGTYGAYLITDCQRRSGLHDNHLDVIDYKRRAIHRDTILYEVKRALKCKCKAAGKVLNCSRDAVIKAQLRVICEVLGNGIVEYYEFILDEIQCGFRKQHGTVNMIITARQIQEKVCNPYVCFFDLKKATHALWPLLLHHGFPLKMVNIIILTWKLLFASKKPYLILLRLTLVSSRAAPFLFNLALPSANVPYRLEPTGLDHADASEVCAAANQAEQTKIKKYSYLTSLAYHSFTPVATGVCGPRSMSFLSDLGRRIANTTDDKIDFQDGVEMTWNKLPTSVIWDLADNVMTHQKAYKNLSQGFQMKLGLEDSV
ncbi:hypothetical protein EMCRGX_G025790 [Ephydatia muelleri]